VLTGKKFYQFNPEWLIWIAVFSAVGIGLFYWLKKYIPNVWLRGLVATLITVSLDWAMTPIF
jgi:hypothetical protein